MSPKTYLVTGSNRGLGLELVRQISLKPNNVVIATARSEKTATELIQLSKERSNVHFIALEGGNHESYDHFSKELVKLNPTVDVLIANLGVSYALYPPLDTPSVDLLAHFNINVVSQLDVLKIVYPYMQKSSVKKIAFMSSLAGSISDIPKVAFATAYGVSKLALNYYMRLVSLELAPQGFTTISLHPGLVMTDMGKKALELQGNPELLKKAYGAIEPDTSVRGMLKVIEQLSVDTFNGSFIDYTGKILPF